MPLPARFPSNDPSGTNQGTDGPPQQTTLATGVPSTLFRGFTVSFLQPSDSQVRLTRFMPSTEHPRGFPRPGHSTVATGAGQGRCARALDAPSKYPCFWASQCVHGLRDSRGLRTCADLEE